MAPLARFRRILFLEPVGQFVAESFSGQRVPLILGPVGNISLEEVLSGAAATGAGTATGGLTAIRFLEAVAAAQGQTVAEATLEAYIEGIATGLGLPAANLSSVALLQGMTTALGVSIAALSGELILAAIAAGIGAGGGDPAHPPSVTYVGTLGYSIPDSTHISSFPLGSIDIGPDPGLVIIAGTASRAGSGNITVLLDGVGMSYDARTLNTTMLACIARQRVLAGGSKTVQVNVSGASVWAGADVWLIRGNQADAPHDSYDFSTNEINANFLEATLDIPRDGVAFYAYGRQQTTGTAQTWNNGAIKRSDASMASAGLSTGRRSSAEKINSPADGPLTDDVVRVSGGSNTRRGIAAASYR